ncbi:bifunctional adenosylcobinamide kinase/adenosylcobinamide-phosphate guanylyltransferase [Pseudoalteromonas fenneropenaei]|uniref:Bifunctional adenosylcobalamin biosynthesis protein n=1 Tax=Pseudoalteromonas fenneropenaei TaxID=1737459 RepID=A0ABV7CL74_9GAMM
MAITTQLELILGGARSGKSRLAEQRAEQWLESGAVDQLFYLATGTAQDQEMQARIAHHQQQRQAHWQVIEAHWQLHDVMTRLPANSAVVVDCLTLWFTHGLCEYGLEAFLEAKHAFVESLQMCQAKVILVSNEVGQGIVPLGALSRQFVDEAGRLHQELASIATRVDFVMAGLPLTLKGAD